MQQMRTSLGTTLMITKGLIIITFFSFTEQIVWLSDSYCMLHGKNGGEKLPAAMMLVYWCGWAYRRIGVLGVEAAWRLSCACPCVCMWFTGLLRKMEFCRHGSVPNDTVWCPTAHAPFGRNFFWLRKANETQPLRLPRLVLSGLVFINYRTGVITVNSNIFIFIIITLLLTCTTTNIIFNPFYAYHSKTQGCLGSTFVKITQNVGFSLLASFIQYHKKICIWSVRCKGPFPRRSILKLVAWIFNYSANLSNYASHPTR